MCVQMCECNNGGGIQFDGETSRLTSSQRGGMPECPALPSVGLPALPPVQQGY